jgi:YidC/Oxa1 family membrane protein insertase
MNIFTVLLTQPLANGLILFYKLLGGNLGLAIIAFSLALKFILNPLTKPYMESMKRIKDLAPHLEKLKKKHKGDKVKLAQAQAELYKQKGVNPSAGCLPYLLQIVVLIAFFNMFTRTLTGDDPTGNFNNFLYDSLRFDADHVLNVRFMYLDLTRPDVINADFLPFGLPGPILILAAIAQFVSAKIMTPYTAVAEQVAKRTKPKEDDLQVAMQKSMIYTFPIFTLVFGMQFVSALTLYWLIFSIAQAYQQYSIQGWGGLTPWLVRANLIKSDNTK